MNRFRGSFDKLSTLKEKFPIVDVGDYAKIEEEQLIYVFSRGAWVTGTPLAGGKTFTELTDVPPDYLGQAGKVVVVNGTEDGLEFVAGSGGDSFTNPDPSVITVGGIPAGTTFLDQTLEDLFNMMLYPELFPTLTAPSNTFVLTQAGLHEIAAVIATLNFTATFNRGSISPAYGTSGFRSGLPNLYDYTGVGLVDTPSISLTDLKTVLNYTVLAGAQSWQSRVGYSIGEQPLSSIGNNYMTPLPAGFTGNITRTITGVYPWYYNSVSLLTATKQALAVMGSMVTTNMLAEDGINKQFVEFPTGWGAITLLQQYNTLSGLWDVVPLGTFTISAVTETVQGNIISYSRYTYNGATIGARILRWTV